VPQLPFNVLSLLILLILLCLQIICMTLILPDGIISSPDWQDDRVSEAGRLLVCLFSNRFLVDGVFLRPFCLFFGLLPFLKSLKPTKKNESFIWDN